MSHVAQGVPMHKFHQVFLSIEDFYTLLLRLFVQLELLGNELQLSRKGHIETFLAWVDELIEFGTRLILVNLAKMFHLCEEL